MPRIATDAADDVRGEVLLLRAIVFSVTNLAAWYAVRLVCWVSDGRRLTILACLVLVVTEGTVESSELTKLVALELVLAFWDRRSLFGLVCFVRAKMEGGHLQSR